MRIMRNNEFPFASGATPLEKPEEAKEGTAEDFPVARTQPPGCLIALLYLLTGMPLK